MISPQGIPNCGSCNHYSGSFCNVNPTYLGKAPECSYFDRISTTTEIEDTCRNFSEWMKTTNKSPITQLIISKHHPFYEKFKEAGYSSTSVSKDGELRWFIFDKKVTTE
jgi:hypothetical protein